MNQPTNDHYDLAVIGLGSAGEALASQAARAGFSVIGFEPHLVGGECPFYACMPSKAMLHDAASTDRDWAGAIARRDEVVDHRDDTSHARSLSDAGVDIVRHAARIEGEGRVRAGGRVVGAERIVVATGAGPIMPPIEGLDSDRVWTSDDALSSSERPESLLIIGGGPIGSELSEVYARYGTEVALVERRAVLDDSVEPEISELLQNHLAALGVQIHLDTDVRRLEWTSDGAVAHTSGGDRLPAARVLVAAGVRPRLEGIGLETVGLTADAPIDDDGRIAGSDWLFAAGDVTPQSKWTHGANAQAARLLALFRGATRSEGSPVMPSCVFTNPPLGRVGQTAAEAHANGVDVIVGTGRLSDIARSTTDELTDGCAKIVVDRSSGTIVGGSMFGARADDLVQIVTVLVHTRTTLEQAASIVFPFPTIGQIVEVALDDAHRQYRSPEETKGWP